MEKIPIYRPFSPKNTDQLLELFVKKQQNLCIFCLIFVETHEKYQFIDLFDTSIEAITNALRVCVERYPRYEQ